MENFIYTILTINTLTITILFFFYWKKIKEFKRRLLLVETSISNLSIELSKNNKKIYRILDVTNKEITLVERTIMNKIDQEIKKTNKHIDDEVNNIHKNEEELYKEIELIHNLHNKNTLPETDVQRSTSFDVSKIDSVVFKK